MRRIVFGFALAATVLSATAATAAGLPRLNEEAAALRPLVSAPLPQSFLDVVPRLPAMESRTVLQETAAPTYLSEREAAALPEDQRGRLKPVSIDSLRYYTTRYGSPLAYLRVVDLLAQSGVDGLRGRRVLDFGYGTVAHLRLFAELGAEAVGVDVDPFLRALYSEPQDTGAIGAGRVRLVHGRYPVQDDAARAVGDGYDVVISKNTLKRGYVRPIRAVDPRTQIDLGVPPAEFVRRVHDALRPGGLFVVYNLMGRQAPEDKPYVPAADGALPFTRAELEAAGFDVLALDVNDDAFARAMGRALGWDRRADGSVNPEFDQSLFAMYSIARRR